MRAGAGAVLQAPRCSHPLPPCSRRATRLTACYKGAPLQKDGPESAASARAARAAERWRPTAESLCCGPRRIVELHDLREQGELGRMMSPWNSARDVQFTGFTQFVDDRYNLYPYKLSIYKSFRFLILAGSTTTFSL